MANETRKQVDTNIDFATHVALRNAVVCERLAAESRWYADDSRRNRAIAEAVADYAIANIAAVARFERAVVVCHALSALIAVLLDENGAN